MLHLKHLKQPKFRQELYPSNNPIFFFVIFLVFYLPKMLFFVVCVFFISLRLKVKAKEVFKK